MPLKLIIRVMAALKENVWQRATFYAANKTQSKAYPEYGAINAIVPFVTRS